MRVVFIELDIKRKDILKFPRKRQPRANTSPLRSTGLDLFINRGGFPYYCLETHGNVVSEINTELRGDSVVTMILDIIVIV